MEVMIASEEFNFASLCPSPSSSAKNYSDTSTDFAFCFSGHLQVPADVLFDGGNIRPLKPLPRTQYQHNIATYSPKSPRSPKRMLAKSDFMASPHEKCDYPLLTKLKKKHEERPQPALVKQISKDTTSSSSSSGSSSSSSLSLIWSRRWKLTDLFMSKENVTNKDDSASIMKGHKKKDTNEWSFRSESSSKSSSSRGGACRRKGRVSAHEWHYKQNRAAAEEMRRKTFLPYKKSLLGCIDVDTGVVEFSRGYGVEITC